MCKFKVLDTVVFLKAKHSLGLPPLARGTIVEKLRKKVFEVEFCDHLGKTITMLAIKAKHLFRIKKHSS